MKRILIVDDDRKGIAPLAIRLKAAGYEVATAVNGIEGLKLAVRDRPDLIVMDVWMPDGLGILTAQRLKHFGLANVPVIFITAGTKETLWAIAEEVKPAGFFEKPYDSKEIVASIGSLLGNCCIPVALLSPQTKSHGKANHEKNTYYRG